jgi:hypothetical protein
MSDKNSINNTNNLSELNWELIFILNEIHQYSVFRDLIEISQINKNIRKKLSNKIFKVIKLKYYHFPQFPVFIVHDTLNNGFSNSDLPSFNFKSSEIDSLVTKLSTDIEKISTYLKGLKFICLFEMGYYTIPIVVNFGQLSSLEISNSTIDLNRFIKLMPKLTSLESLSLSELTFMKLPAENQNEFNIIIPETLKELSLSQLHISTTSIDNSPIDFFYNSESYILKQDFYLPPQPLRNLEKLKLSSDINNLIFINDFLALNPQLNYFSFPMSILSLESIEILSFNNNIKHIKIDLKNNSSISPDLDLPYIYSLNSLYVSAVEPERYSRLFQLADSFVNLIKMDINTKYYNIEFITSMLKKLNKLKFLSLKIEKFSKKELDFVIYSQIETLKIEFRTIRTIIYTLPNSSSNLSSISILSGKQYKDNYDSICETSKSTNNWRAKLFGKRIYCYTIKG